MPPLTIDNRLRHYRQIPPPDLCEYAIGIALRLTAPFGGDLQYHGAISPGYLIEWVSRLC